MAEETQDNVQGGAETPEAPADNLPPNTVTVEDAGEAIKKITIEIDRKRIDAKFNEMFGELRESAIVPGFRKGHAPRRLIEKRFGKEVGEDVRNSLISESLGSAIEDKGLKILGEPDIKLDEIELPETGNLTYSVTVEVKPDFDLPDYKNIPVTDTSVEVTDASVDEAIKNFLSSRGVMAPVDGKAEAGDLVVADVSFSGEGIDAQTRENVELRVAPGVVEGVPLEDLGEKLTGVKAGGKAVKVETEIPEGHPTEDWRGKKIAFEISPKEIKRLEVPALTDELAGEFGFENAAELTDYVRARLSQRAQIEAQQAKRDQVARYLLDNTKLDLPAGVAARMTAAALRRRYIDLLYRGVPREQIEQNLEMLQAQAGEQARTELKLSFILESIAEAEEITVEEGEINARIAQMAASYGRRPERLRSELANEGTLEQVGVQLREQKTIDKLLSMAQVTAPAEKAAPADEPAKPAKKAKASKKKADQDQGESNE